MGSNASPYGPGSLKSISLPKPSDSPEDAKAAEARARGISWVAGQEVELKDLLRGGWPADNVVEDVKKIEMVAPFIRPFGCGPVAPREWLVLRTYPKIIEVRDEIRMDHFGLNMGDRTFKRCYQTAMRELHEQGGSSLGTHQRAPIVQEAFRCLLDKLWHRHLFPFGTYAVSCSGNKHENDFREPMQQCKSKTSGTHQHVMNPFSVTAADILYLCNTGGYLERFVYVIGVIIWAKTHGCNLLHHRRPGKGVNKLDEYYTLEKHLHVFGSIILHLTVMENNKIDVGGNWGEMIQVLNKLLGQAMGDFQVDKSLVENRVKELTIKTAQGNFSVLNNYFTRAARIGETGSGAAAGAVR